MPDDEKSSIWITQEAIACADDTKNSWRRRRWKHLYAQTTRTLVCAYNKIHLYAHTTKDSRVHIQRKIVACADSHRVKYKHSEI